MFRPYSRSTGMVLPITLAAQQRMAVRPAAAPDRATAIVRDIDGARTRAIPAPQPAEHCARPR